jgi:ATP-dependent RNA helicase CshB
MKRGIRFEHMRWHNGQWQTLTPFGGKRPKKDDELEKKISQIMTKKNTKVKPGYKKKRAAAIQRVHRQKKREMIRSKIPGAGRFLWKEML